MRCITPSCQQSSDPEALIEVAYARWFNRERQLSWMLDAGHAGPLKDVRGRLTFARGGFGPSNCIHADAHHLRMRGWHEWHEAQVHKHTCLRQL